MLAQEPAAKASDPASAQQGRNDRGEWADPVKDAPAGTSYATCFSKTINGPYSYLVYLPPGYELNAGKRYPVIYWLHGGGGSQRTGEYFVDNYANAIKSGHAPAAILILVNGVGGSLFCNSFDGRKPVETAIIDDLIPHVDATYRTFGTRGMRAIEGFSMGGFGALHLAFKFPEKFGSVTSISHAPIRPNSGWEKVDRVYREGPLGGSVEFFNANDPFQLVDRNAGAIRDGMTLRFIVGDKDQPGTQARTKEFFEKTRKLGLKSELTIVPGVAHSCPKLYEVIGAPVFAYYAKYFAAAALRETSAAPSDKPGETRKKAKASAGAPEGKAKRPRAFAWIDPVTDVPPGLLARTCFSK
ncbi:MAG: alpha/beta hydrolase-fold protein [Opitutaceae bacterium]|nr:alpha/beta hydrolase-fold protein [Opitutaceae bacterium]